MAWMIKKWIKIIYDYDGFAIFGRIEINVSRDVNANKHRWINLKLIQFKFIVNKRLILIQIQLKSCYVCKDSSKCQTMENENGKFKGKVRNDKTTSINLKRTINFPTSSCSAWAKKQNEMKLYYGKHLLLLVELLPRQIREKSRKIMKKDNGEQENYFYLFLGKWKVRFIIKENEKNAWKMMEIC